MEATTLTTITKQIRKIQKAGGSYVIALPKDSCLELGFSPLTFVFVRQVGPALVISRVTNVEDPSVVKQEADQALADLLAAAQKEGKR